MGNILKNCAYVYFSIIGNVVGLNELSKHKNLVGSTTFANYLAGKNSRLAHNQQTRFNLGLPKEPRGTKEMDDTYNDGQLQLLNTLDADSDSDSEEFIFPDAGNIANSDIYESPIYRDVNDEIAHLIRPNIGIHLYQQSPESGKNWRQNVVQYDKRAPSDRSQTDDTPNSGLRTVQQSVDNIIKTPSKRYFSLFWKGVFGRLRAHRMEERKAKNKNELKRDRYYGNRFRYFDTLASRLLGK